jgi:glyoxylase-like metal-dependent hydrolase (beta-lactamase superfamily II)
MVALVVLGAAGLLMAHLGIRRELTPLPTVSEVASAVAEGELPGRLSWLNTAGQTMPRRQVLDARRDPAAGRPYRLSHPVFVVEWADGRMLLVDTGMTPQGALAFGRPMELMAGAGPMEPVASVAELLADELPRVGAVVFTHLHEDHVGGMDSLCAGHGEKVKVFMTEAQAKRPNYLTRAGLRRVSEAPCADMVILENEGPLLPVPGYAGVWIIAAGGHTPGSQMVVVRLGAGGSFLLVGDVVNQADGIVHGIPKPLLYRTLIVPEYEQRLVQLRSFARRLEAEAGFEALVSHDQYQLERLLPRR